MTPEQLKLSILQYAIQGKLVEQREEEGTAEDLYDEIMQNREILIKEGKIKENKGLTKITEEEKPFEIPNTWKWVKWGNIVNIVSARRVHKSDWKDKGVPFYRAREIAEMSRNNGYVENELFISEELYKKYSISGIPQPGDIMVTAVGTLGKTYIVKRGDRFYYKDASVICLENRFDICSEYLALIMQTPFMKSQIKNNSSGTTVETLTMKKLMQYILPLPPKQEQYRIVAMIEKILPLIDQYETSWEKLEQLNTEFPDKMKKSILQYAIQGKLVEQRPEEGTAEDLYEQIKEEKNKLIKEGKIKKEKALAKITEEEVYFDIPDTWKWVKLGEVITLQSGQDLKRTEYNDSKEGIPYITGASNINDNGEIIINRWTDVPKAYANSGDLLLTCKGTVGKMAFLEYDKVHIARQIMAIKTYYIDTRYIKYFLETQILNLKNKAKSMIPGIERNNVLNLLLPLPPLKEQYRIVKKIEELLIYCSKLEK